MSTSFAPYRFDAKDLSWHQQAIGDPNAERPIVDLSLGNAIEVLAALGLPCQSVCQVPVPIGEFIERTIVALRASIDHPSPALDSRMIITPAGVAIVTGPRDEGYIGKRILDLALIARRGQEAGATHIGWC